MVGLAAKFASVLIVRHSGEEEEGVEAARLELWRQPTRPRNQQIRAQREPGLAEPPGETVPAFDEVEPPLLPSVMAQISDDIAFS